jgi:hypothetical protein
MSCTLSSLIATARYEQNAPPRQRRGHVLALLAVLTPVLIGVIALIFDGGLIMHECRNLQHVTDAAATAAAFDLRSGESNATAVATAEELIRVANSLPDATVRVHIPPTTGEFAGRTGYVEIESEVLHRPYFMPLLDGILERKVATRAVAGVDDVTAGAAIVVLDPNPAPLSIPPLPALPLLPTLIAGFEVEGLGRLSVDGAVLVNTEWGGVDENGNPAGNSSGPPYALACMPVLPLTRLMAADIRVVGGVDEPSNYQNIAPAGPGPLQANRLPVPDPYRNLPVPTTQSDPTNVSAQLRGGVRVIGLPLIGPPVTLRPGVYEYISVVSGIANFQPGVYIIRGVDPLTQTSLSMVAGTVNAQGVMFYITNSPTYNGVSGAPDVNDGETSPSTSGAAHLVPSVLIQASLLGSGLSPIADAVSPFDGIVIYQRRHDRRPIALIHQSLLGAGELSGAIYAKWGHLIFVGNGAYDLRFVCGTLRILTLFNTTLEPSRLFPPARDVLLVQ